MISHLRRWSLKQLSPVVVSRVGLVLAHWVSSFRRASLALQMLRIIYSEALLRGSSVALRATLLLLKSETQVS